MHLNVTYDGFDEFRNGMSAIGKGMPGGIYKAVVKEGKPPPSWESSLINFSLKDDVRARIKFRTSSSYRGNLSIYLRMAPTMPQSSGAFSTISLEKEIKE